MRRALAMVLLMLALACLPALAIDPLPFKDATEEARFQHLVRELRCMVCQNQNLADSDAGLAKDLRAEVFELMRSGKDDAQIKLFLTDRYGDFVLYKPPVKPGTWLLWFGPLLMLAIGFLIARRQIGTRGAAPASSTTANEKDGEFS